MIVLYEEYILDEKLLIITKRIKLFVKHLQAIQNSNNNEPIREGEEFFYMEQQKPFSKILANIFNEIEVIFFNYS